jgi:hypothetical protein
MYVFCELAAIRSWRGRASCYKRTMKNDILASLARLSDTQLLTQIKSLVGRERDVTAEIVAHLAELETRDVYLREGYPSLFVYCRDVLGLSEWEAYNRIDVARAARRFPVILDLLAEGSVNLTTVKLLAPHLTSANHHDVLNAARGKKKGEIEELVANLAPRPDVQSSVRRLSRPAHSRASEAAAHSVSVDSLPIPEGGLAFDPVCGQDPPNTLPIPARIPAVVAPLSPDRYKFQVTIGGETLEKIRLAKDMLGHAIPSGDDAAILDRAFTALLAELAKKKFAQTPNPSPSPCRPRNGKVRSEPMREPAARTPSAAVKRVVWLRDLGRCAFIGSGGHRCDERRFVEFHHVDPYALGGEATIDGIQLRCRRHNDYEGRLYFGEGRRASSRADRGLVPEQVRLSVSRSTP